MNADTCTHASLFAVEFHAWWVRSTWRMSRDGPHVSYCANHSEGFDRCDDRVDRFLEVAFAGGPE